MGMRAMVLLGLVALSASAAIGGRAEAARATAPTTVKKSAVASGPVVRQVYPGVWRITLGTPEKITPTSAFEYKPSVSGLAKLPKIAGTPSQVSGIVGMPTPRGFQVSIPLGSDEQIYGFGLQLQSFNQRNKKKTLRVNSDPVADIGDSHAPVPFYVTTAGYGVLVDTLRYSSFYCGGVARRSDEVAAVKSDKAELGAKDAADLYRLKAGSGSSDVIVDIPYADGVDVYVFAGPGMKEAVQRYNLFSGGGCLPPRWGLGVWYRCKGDFDSAKVMKMASYFRDSGIPCDVLGLEPGWQTHAYSCSLMWSDKFADPKAMTDELAKMNFHLNCWTQAFIHPSSPIYKDMLPYSGDYTVWQGLVPDFINPKAREIFADFAGKTHIDAGVSGYKLDECDNSDYIGYSWSFPEMSRFPSGVDGDRMHSAFGMLDQQAMVSAFEKRNKRTYGDVRSSYALAAPQPFALYSDLYDHRTFIRGVVNCGFSGLLWTPEVRNAWSEEELIRRTQSVIFSPQALIDAWFISNPPWLQWDADKNNADQFADEKDRTRVTAACKSLFELRMRLIPYLYSAFYNYHLTGAPPFRALVMDDPKDQNLWNDDSSYMVGDRLLVAPVVTGQWSRDVYLPKGGWRDFWTNERFEGGKSYHFEVPLDKILVFVKDNSILPLAEPVTNAADPGLMKLTVAVYGSGEQGITLYEDDGLTYDYRRGAYNRVDLSWNAGKASIRRTGSTDVSRYEIKATETHP